MRTALMTETEAELIKAGNCLSEMLGMAVAAMDGGEPFTYEEAQMGRSAILGWHRVRLLMTADLPGE